jgi:hypothetical protein
MRGDVITLDRAVELARTGDVWVFRGTSGADRAIRGLTNAPVNHVGMAVALDDLPPLMWHAELGRSLPDMWTGKRQRGVQLHDLRAAVLQWGQRYGQRGWVRQLSGELTREHEDGLLRAIARLDGTPFPSTAALAGRWLRGRVPQLRRAADHDEPDEASLATAYCAEVVALTFVESLLPDDHRPSWYDPGRFWSGDDLDLAPGFALGGEIEVVVPLAADPDSAAAAPKAVSAHPRRWKKLLRR